MYNGKTLDKDDNGVIYLNASEFLEELKVYDRNYLYNKNGITDGNEDNDAVNISIEDDFEDRDIWSFKSNVHEWELAFLLGRGW